MRLIDRTPLTAVRGFACTYSSKPEHPSSKGHTIHLCIPVGWAGHCKHTQGAFRRCGGIVRLEWRCLRWSLPRCQLAYAELSCTLPRMTRLAWTLPGTAARTLSV